ncbi:lyase family protein [Nocardia jiangsuensis]|uniref:argininosuccinate lyase n=1 Tax=Nocardia jiangsuensis TaxID=1691563 RepID=A0ABV8E155_9NOCA
MSDTGRIREPLGPRTRHQIYGAPSQYEIATELDRTSRIDLAHVVMLTECGLVGAADAHALLAAILRLRDGEFAALRSAPIPRGLYMAYEQCLGTMLGEDVSGRLHTGRSRNDMKATVTLTRLHEWLLTFTEESTRLVAVLLSRAGRNADVVMPVYTHFQAAMPVTYGYYLIGVASALTRQLEALRDTARDLRRCPMGAGAVAGTDLPIDPSRIASLLGFESPPLHAIDAIASRDTGTRMLAVAVEVAVLLSRLGTDLQLWSTEEFGFLSFPDRLVGASSAMPQKRNAFLLEHLKAGAGSASAAWAGAMASIKSTPFTNSIEVGTEAVELIWPGLATATDMVLLAQVLVSGARPRPERMLTRAEEGFVTATAVTNELVRRDVPFRKAHHAVGAAVREALERGARELAASSPALRRFGLPPESPGPRAAMARAEFGGGPARWRAAYDDVHARVAELRRWRTTEAARVRRASAELDAAVGELLARRADAGVVVPTSSVGEVAS